MPAVSPLWTPPEKFVEQSNLTAYASWLKQVHGLHFSDYAALRQWSAAHPGKFWETIAGYFKIIWRHPYELVMSSDPMPYTLGSAAGSSIMPNIFSGTQRISTRQYYSGRSVTRWQP